jgi:hypothetical protein
MEVAVQSITLSVDIPTHAKPAVCSWDHPVACGDMSGLTTESECTAMGCCFMGNSCYMPAASQPLITSTISLLPTTTLTTISSTLLTQTIESETVSSLATSTGTFSNNTSNQGFTWDISLIGIILGSIVGVLILAAMGAGIAQKMRQISESKVESQNEASSVPFQLEFEESPTLERWIEDAKYTSEPMMVMVDPSDTSSNFSFSKSHVSYQYHDSGSSFQSPPNHHTYGRHHHDSYSS